MKKPFQQRGVAAVEFAILLPLLLFIVFGITEFGRALYAYNTIVKGTRDAARYAMMQQPGGSADPVTKCLAVYGITDCNPSIDTPLAPGLTLAMVSVCDSVSCAATHQAQGTAPPVNLVTVTVSGYAYQSPIISFFKDDSSSFTFADISTTMKGNL
jgi:Flp pilus assembly protein TadG